MRLAALLSSSIAVSACSATLSEPRGTVHLDAFAEGRRHFHHGRYADAARSFDRSAVGAERRVDRDEARYLQARAHRRAGDLERALGLYDQIAQGRPVSRRTVRALYDASFLRHQLGRALEAEAGFQRIIRRHPDHGVASRSLFRVRRAFELRRDESGLVELLRSLYPEIRESALADNLLWIEVELSSAAGDAGRARWLLERIVQDHPYPRGHLWDDALMRLADLDLTAGEPESAIARLQQLVDQNEETSIVGSYTLPTFPRALMRIGRIYRDEIGDLGAAAEAFRRFDREFPRSSLRDDALFELAEVLRADGSPRRACRALERVVTEFEVGHARRRAEARLREGCQ